MTVGQNIGVKEHSMSLHVKGEDSYRFLNGMLSQDVQKSSSYTGSRAFFLTNKGKIIAPLYYVTLNHEEILLWSEESSMQALYEGLGRYLVADKVTLQLGEKFIHWSLCESAYSFEALKNRHPLGLEKIFVTQIQDNTFIIPQGRLGPNHVEVFTRNKNFLASEMTSHEYWERSFNSGTPQWGVDLYTEDFFLEFPLSDAVSFDKGCYIGQETVARGTFRGKVNKSYARFYSNKTISTGEILTESGQKVGDIRSANNNKATGIAKFDIDLHQFFLINGEKHELKIDYLVKEDTFRKGR